jgi:putative DNA primase/helicase
MMRQLDEIFHPPGWTPDGNGNGNHDTKAVETGPMLVCVADVEPRAIEWIWPSRIPAGRITMLVGRPGAGKSFLCSEITARVTTGSPWPDGRGKAPLGDVLIISAEDDAHDTLRPRLDASQADVNRVHLLTCVRRVDADGNQIECTFTLSDVLNLEKALQRLNGCKLCIVDPIGSYLGSRTDAHRENEVRAILAPVAQLAERYGVAMLVVAHRRKSGGETADATTLGSTGFTGIARAVYHLSRDPQNKARRLLLPGKHNLSEEPDGLAFTISGDPPCVQWEADAVSMNADDALADERTSGPEPEAREAAATWLRSLLASGEVESKEVERQAKDAGLAWRTVRRAADEIGIKREKNGFSGKWQWRLSKPGKQLGQAAGRHVDKGQLGQHGQLEGKTA